MGCDVDNGASVLDRVLNAKLVRGKEEVGKNIGFCVMAGKQRSFSGLSESVVSEEAASTMRRVCQTEAGPGRSEPD